MDQYVLERHRHGVAVTQHDIAETIADENHVNSRFVDDARSWIVVSGETNEAFAALFTQSQRRCTDLFRPLRLQIGHFQFSLHHEMWTMELPVKQQIWKCRGRDNKCGHYSIRGLHNQSAVSAALPGFQRTTAERSVVSDNNSSIRLPSTGWTRRGTSSFSGTSTKRRAASRG